MFVIADDLNVLAGDINRFITRNEWKRILNRMSVKFALLLHTSN